MFSSSCSMMRSTGLGIRLAGEAWRQKVKAPEMAIRQIEQEFNGSASRHLDHQQAASPQKAGISGLARVRATGECYPEPVPWT